MSILDDVAVLKRKIEDLKIKRARLQERLESEKAEKERLIQEAQELGVQDPAKIGEWVEEKKQEFAREFARVSKLIEEASK
jgi:hypothetical protein